MSVQSAHNRIIPLAGFKHPSVFGRTAAWVAAFACDKRTSFKFAVVFAIVHGLFWTVILTTLKSAQDVHMDVAESYAWGRHFLLGYGKHPPFMGWVAGIWFSIFPAMDWSTYALAMATLACSLVICWLVAVRVVDRRRAMFSVVMLAIYPIFNFKGFKYNADLLQLVTLPLLVLAYLHAFEKRDIKSGIWLGVAAAAAMMTKYWALTMIGAIGVAALMNPQRTQFLRSPAPWVAMVSFVVAMLPHLIWLIQVDFLPLTYAGDVYGERSFSTTLKLATNYMGHNVGLLLLPAAFACIALSWRRGAWQAIREHGLLRDMATSASRFWPGGLNSNLVQARNIWWIQIVVALGPPLAAMIFHVYIKTDWGIPIFFLVPLALISIPELRIRRMPLVRLMSMWLIFTIIALIIAPLIAAGTLRADNQESPTFSPRSEFAIQLTEAWRSRFHTRWAVVAGSSEIGESMTFYSPDHPATLTPDEVWSSGLTSLDEARRLGFIGACDTNIEKLFRLCESWMNEHAPNAERLDWTSRRYYRGSTGPWTHWHIWIEPPAAPEHAVD